MCLNKADLCFGYCSYCWKGLFKSLVGLLNDDWEGIRLGFFDDLVGDFLVVVRCPLSQTDAT